MKKNNNLDEDYGLVESFSFYEDTLSISKLSVYLDEKIQDARYYRHLYHRMLQLGEDDIVHIYLNTPGGNLQGASLIMQAMDQTDAKVVCIITGECMSAGTLIALKASSLIVTEDAYMMFHTASTGSFGKLQELSSGINFDKQRIEEMMKDAYTNFLTDKEIEELFIGKDFHLDYKEITRRLENRQKIIEKKLKVKKPVISL